MLQELSPFSVKEMWLEIAEKCTRQKDLLGQFLATITSPHSFLCNTIHKIFKF